MSHDAVWILIMVAVGAVWLLSLPLQSIASNLQRTRELLEDAAEVRAFEKRKAELAKSLTLEDAIRDRECGL